MLITQSIDIKEFIDSKGFDPLLIEKSYYVAPEKKKKSGVGPVKFSKSNVYSLI
jgi:cytochrome oxidase assembly protein ShyY1